MRNLSLLLLSLLLVQCSWLLPKKEVLPELPPPTREGNNTFGCYLNDKPWTPKGRMGTRSNLNMTYDPTYNGGHLAIRAFRIEGNREQFMTIGLDSLTKAGIYSLSLPNKLGGAYFNDYNDHNNTACEYNDDSNLYRKGSLTITRFDLQARVIAGTFEFTLARPGCDTVRVTDGRFDMRIY